jgi:uncharacterized protein YdiU (UPF0061 family)
MIITIQLLGAGVALYSLYLDGSDVWHRSVRIIICSLLLNSVFSCMFTYLKKILDEIVYEHKK